MQLTHCYLIHEMSFQEVEELEKKMRPGNCSTEGFISWDDRLLEIDQNDTQFLESEGISCEFIADSLKGLIRKAEAIKDFSAEKMIGTKFKISGTGIATNGYQECPFPKVNGKHCHEGRRDYIVTNVLTGESVSFSDLAIHLIETHRFFEGNTAYRVDPAKLIRVLDLKLQPYERKIAREWTYSGGFDLMQNDPKYEKRLQKYAKKIIQIDEFAVAYLGVPFKYYELYKYSGKTKREQLTIEHKKKNLTDEQIQLELEKQISIQKMWRKTHTLDEVQVHSTGKEYLHFVNKKDRVSFNDIMSNAPAWNPIVEDAVITTNITFAGNSVHELKESSYADIDCG